MDSEIDRAVERQAIGWIIRLRNGDDEDWQRFEQWLAECPGHGAAYRRIEDIDLDIGPLLADVDFHRAANDDGVGADDDGDDDGSAGAAPARRRRWAGAAALAATILAAAAVVPQLLHDRYEVRTGPGETRTIALENGTRVTLNGGTRLVLDRKDPRLAELASGEALFEVRHDARRPFRVSVAGRTVEDAGTVFNLAYEGKVLRLAVAEGKVLYEPGPKQTELGPGQTLSTAADGREIALGTTRDEAVGSWRKGELVYRGEPLSAVAGDLSRLLGVALQVDPAIASRPYFGTIILRRGDTAQLKPLMTALNVKAVREGAMITMKPLDDGSP